MPNQPTQQGANLAALSDLCTPWCLRVVATLRIADHLVASMDKIEDLAAATGCDAVSLHRVLRHLVGQGVFEEGEPGRFALNQPAQGLLDPAQRLGLDLEGIGGRMAYAWYLLKKVLNDWPDREATAILRRCAEAARPTGRVVVLGGVSTADVSRGLDVEMVLAGGKDRTLAELRELARQAGLKVLAAEQQRSGSFVVECRPT